MAQRAAASPARRSKRAPARSSNRRRAGNRRAGTGYARRRRYRDVGELERVIRSLENRLARLTSADNIRSSVSGATNQVGNVVTKASNQVGEMVADTLTEVATKIRGGATSVTGVARLGTGAIQRIGEELERRPLMTVAVALGIGFLAGLAGRRE
jgi:ElaB/YqjD/DUF883 family membrane-anchored ribosome-binding protein